MFELKPTYLSGRRDWGEKEEGKKKRENYTKKKKTLIVRKKGVGFLGHSNGSFWTREFHRGERRKRGRKRKKKNTNQKEKKNLSLEWENHS